MAREIDTRPRIMIANHAARNSKRDSMSLYASMIYFLILYTLTDFLFSMNVFCSSRSCKETWYHGTSGKG